MDGKLMAEARQAQERLIDAERDAEVARADFNRAVRRLHLHGSSLRELAATLGLSHQRVHQIVEAAGGSRRWVRRRDSPPNPLLACTFCGRTQDKVRKLIAGPSVFICDGCIGVAKTAISSGRAGRTLLGSMAAVPEQETRARCSFCGKHPGQVAAVAVLSAQAGGTAAPTAGICAECLGLCDEILDEEFAEPAPPPD